MREVMRNENKEKDEELHLYIFNVFDKQKDILDESLIYQSERGETISWTHTDTYTAETDNEMNGKKETVYLIKCPSRIFRRIQFEVEGDKHE